ncbi:MAG TPA: uroporphyrinogen-III synthase [Candidatus Acidoferrum sp.]|nr:uroporphyrinogen-III synthase [Candidatus Acidoferrum sp.]
MASPIVSPLAEKTVILTRPQAQSEELCRELTTRGAAIKLLPLISIGPPDDYAPLDDALTRLASFDWIVFTSANAVQAVSQRSQSLAKPRIANAKAPLAAAVGPATAAAAEAAGFSVELVATNHNGVALAGELAGEIRGKSIFLPRSDLANPVLPEALKKLGAAVTEVVAYQTLPPSKADRQRLHAVLDSGIDGILFYSPSAVQNFLELLGRDRLERLQGRVLMVAIGPTTAGALSAAGVRRIAWAADTTTKSVIAAFEGHFSRMHKRSAAEGKGK